MASMDVSSTTTLAQAPPASQLLVAVGVGGASKHVAVVRPRLSGGVGQTAARKCHGVLRTWDFFGFSEGRKKKNAWKKTFGVYIVLENNSVIILYSVI